MSLSSKKPPAANTPAVAGGDVLTGAEKFVIVVGGVVKTISLTILAAKIAAINA